jgi:hypothetical protein
MALLDESTLTLLTPTRLECEVDENVHVRIHIRLFSSIECSPELKE